MGLAASGIAEHHDVLPVPDELAGGKLPHEGVCDLPPVPAQIQILQRLRVGKAGLLQAPGVLAFQAAIVLLLQQAEQKGPEVVSGASRPEQSGVVGQTRHLKIPGVQADLLQPACVLLVHVYTSATGASPS